jgi:dipicolinate synthase subunit A
MRRELNLWVVGGDQRQAKLAELLDADGHTVHTFALERAPELHLIKERTLREIELAHCVVLPLPIVGEGSMLNAPLSSAPHTLLSIFDALRPGQIVCGGRISHEIATMAEERGLSLHDYFTREELAVANAIPTAEGAIQLAMEELPITLHRAKVLVVGFGRIGKILAHRLAGLGARVSVSARRYSDLAWIEAYGYGVEHTEELDGWLCGYDLIINTVPAQVLDEKRLRELKDGCVVIDLASKPGGVELDAATALGVKVIWALSLPGKVAPITAGAAIRDTIYNIWQELGV